MTVLCAVNLFLLIHNFGNILIPFVYQGSFFHLFPSLTLVIVWFAHSLGFSFWLSQLCLLSTGKCCALVHANTVLNIPVSQLCIPCGSASPIDKPSSMPTGPLQIGLNSVE